jgi:hypothetical protein
MKTKAREKDLDGNKEDEPMQDNDVHQDAHVDEEQDEDQDHDQDHAFQSTNNTIHNYIIHRLTN